MFKRLINPSKQQSFFLFGARGTGKSTLLREIFKDRNPLWIDLLDQELEFKLVQNPQKLLEMWGASKSEWIVIDEVQKIPNILDVVHQAIEKHQIKFALTGSSARKLKKGGANLLANRAASFALNPFSAIELGDSFDLSKALRLGLLPRFWHSINLSEIDIQRALYSYVQTYLKEEIAAEQLVRNLDPFRRFLVSSAQSNAKIVNYSKIEKDAGISSGQAERHFEIICDTLIGRYLAPYEKSARKRQSKKSKFYFFDTGVLRALQNLAGESLLSSTFEYGEIFETFVINEFFKLRDGLEKRWEFSYLRTKDDAEIDLIIEKPKGKIILVEIKSGETINQEYIRSFKQISSAFSNPSKYILGNFKQNEEIDGIRCLHWLDGLKEIFEIT
jgi:predicted AAA+ superfamily ATPase